jgi:DNA polymerase-3 subunit alpha
VRRYGAELTAEHRQRLQFELEVVEKTGFAAYILFVWDFVAWARQRGIPCGPRGSAAGSIIVYCLGIADLDPVKYGIAFERFLNPERIQMPDIDMDFADDRRDEVIQYVIDKYGADRVAQIITFGRLQPARRFAMGDGPFDLAVERGRPAPGLIPADPDWLEDCRRVKAEPN